MNCCVRDDPTNPSNHGVVSLSMKLECTPIYAVAGDSPHRPHRPPSPNWEKAGPDHVASYQRWLDVLLYHLLQVVDPQAPLACTDVRCRRPDHLKSINTFCDSIVQCCLHASSLSIPHRNFSRRSVAGWNDHARDEREAALHWHRIWVDSGKPMHGDVYNTMKRARHCYHYTVRALKNREMKEKRRILASKVHDKDLWIELKKLNPSVKATTPYVDDAEGDNIADLFADKFEALYCSVPTNAEEIARMQETLANSIQRNIPEAADVCRPDLLQKCLRRLKKRKRDPDSGLDSDHLINGSRSLLLSVSMLFNAMMVHGHTPNHLLKSSVITIPKNPSAPLSSSDNYRGIALCSPLCKVFDLMVLELYSTKLVTSNLQFGFKRKLSTTLCTGVLTEIASHFVKNGSDVYACLLDATKAFDRVHFGKLFRILIARGMPPFIIRILLDAYTRQSICATWGSSKSRRFSVRNGVKQGGVLSPILFTVYFDEMLNRLQKEGIGCTIGPHYVGALAYADDVTLLAPSLRALHQMLRCCQNYADEYAVKFNAKKTQCIKFGSSRNASERLSINGEEVRWANECLHLGSYVNSALNDSADCAYKLSKFFGSVNKLKGNFGHLSPGVIVRLFNSYCCSYYGSQIWNISSRGVASICTNWNKAIRRLLHLPYTTHRYLLPSLIQSPALHCQLEKRFVNFFRSMVQSDNNIVSFISSHTYRNRTSPLGQNIAYLEYYRNINLFDDIKHNMNMIDEHYSLSEEQAACAAAVTELLHCDGVEGFTHDEIESIMFCLCTQ